MVMIDIVVLLARPARSVFPYVNPITREAIPLKGG
jgi:hypothetical protein